MRRRHERRLHAALENAENPRRKSWNRLQETFQPAYRPTTATNISASAPCPSCPRDGRKLPRSGPPLSSKRRPAWDDPGCDNPGRGNDHLDRRGSRSQLRADQARKRNALILPRPNRYPEEEWYQVRQSATGTSERF